METFCSQCNAPMSCKQEPGCWCADFPHVLPVPDEAAKGCLCRSCLTKRIELHETPSRSYRGAPQRDLCVAGPWLSEDLLRLNGLDAGTKDLGAVVVIRASASSSMMSAVRRGMR
jgi:hypothetical protein